LTFVVKEVQDGKVINSREYLMSIGTTESTSNSFNARSIRTVTKVPVETEPGKVTYLDVGVSIDCRNVLAAGNKMAMDLSAEISRPQGEDGDQVKSQAHSVPLILENKWNSQVVVSLGKPTVVFSSDEVSSKRAIQLELTANEIR
jgi:hypothetical protein